jgi:hypothetical protein
MSNVFNVANLPEQLIWTGVIAHTAIQQPKDLPRFQDLDGAIDSLEAMALRYLHLFRGAVFPSGLLPAWQYDWKEIFRYPWIS